MKRFSTALPARLRCHTGARMMFFIGACLALLLPIVSAASRAGTTYSPRPGSAERKAIMDALRPPLMKAVKRKVIFKVGHLRVRNNWAFMQGNAVNADGTSLGDKYLWGEMAALLRKQGRRWQVLHWGLATDISVMEECRKKYPQAPRSIFPGKASARGNLTRWLRQCVVTKKLSE